MFAKTLSIAVVVSIVSLAASDLAAPITPSPAAGSQAPAADWHQALESRAPIGFFVAGAADVPGFDDGDPQLAAWALRTWERAGGGRFKLAEADNEHALIQLYWVSGADGLYGEMRPFMLDGQRGAAVFVLPDSRGLGGEIHRRAQQDPLFRDTVVYLTCLHELGHAFGLSHSADFDDIMYSFRHGGDIAEYFQRFRDRINSRADIEAAGGLSSADVARLGDLYPS